MNNILEVRNLSKMFRSQWTFRKKAGIEGISFVVKRGESFALLGGNGAGKTTTIKNILGFQIPDTGEVILDDRKLDGSRGRSRIGFLPEQPYFYQYLTVEETLNFYAALFSMSAVKRTERVEYVLDRLAIREKAKDKVKSLSKGQQQRVGLAQVLLNDPELLILDEPFSGLDPLARVEIRNLLYELKSCGKTIIITSHILSDIELLCDRAVILNKGRIRQETNIRELVDAGSTGYKVRIQSFTDEEPVFPETLSSVFTSSMKVSGAIIYSFSSYHTAKEFVKYCFDNGHTVLEFTRTHPTLEDVFISASQD